MAAPRFFVDIPLAPGLLILPDDAAHHAARVLRLAAGDPVVLFNGEGGEHHGQIAGIDRRVVSVQLDRFNPDNRESPLDITLVQSITSGERMDYALQKAVELGVSHIVPIITERASIKLKADRAEKRLEHWRKVIISACEQSGRNVIPGLASICELGQWLEQKTEATCLLLHPQANERLSSVTNVTQAVAIVVGPEGGFSDQEIELMQARGCRLVQLGPRVLRMETAGPAMLAILQAQLGDL